MRWRASIPGWIYASGTDAATRRREARKFWESLRTSTPRLAISTSPRAARPASPEPPPTPAHVHRHWPDLISAWSFSKNIFDQPAHRKTPIPPGQHSCPKSRPQIGAITHWNAPIWFGATMVLPDYQRPHHCISGALHKKHRWPTFCFLALVLPYRLARGALAPTTSKGRRICHQKPNL